MSAKMDLKRAKPPCSFLPFQHLPLELRTLIWYMALPDASQDKPAIFFHDNKFMRPWKAPKGHKEYSPDGFNWYARYFYEEMDPVLVPMPIAHVNREARRVACSHAGELGYVLTQTGNGPPTFSRGMDRGKDILYFENGALINMMEKHGDDMVELAETHRQHHLNPSQYGICSSEVKYLYDLFNEPADVDVAYVFLPEEGNRWLEARPHAGSVQAVRFEADACEGRAWVLNKETRQWAWGPGAVLGDKELNAEIETCDPDIIDTRGWGPLTLPFAPEFYVRPVKAKRVQV